MSQAQPETQLVEVLTVPALKNGHHEKFAAGVANGLNGANAYLAAGYAVAGGAASRSAYRLLNRQDVRERIDELAGKRHDRVAVEQLANGIGTGRPTLYRPELCEMARRLALLGLTDAEIAGVFAIGVITLSRWKQNYPEFRQAIARGGVVADANVAESLYHRAIGYEHLATKIFMPPGAEEPVYAPYVEHYPPDTHAALAWLARRQPGLWRERQQVGLTGSIEHRLPQMTPEERMRDALELVKRRLAEARMTIEHAPAAPAREDEDP